MGHARLPFLSRSVIYLFCNGTEQILKPDKSNYPCFAFRECERLMVVFLAVAYKEIGGNNKEAHKRSCIPERPSSRVAPPWARLLPSLGPCLQPPGLEGVGWTPETSLLLLPDQSWNQESRAGAQTHLSPAPFHAVSPSPLNNLDCLHFRINKAFPQELLHGSAHSSWGRGLTVIIFSRFHTRSLSWGGGPVTTSPDSIFGPVLFSVLLVG